jgi:Lysine methyltransferase
MANYGLDDLFTVKDYQPITIHIPRFRKDEKNGDENDEGDRLSVEILQSPSACTDYDLTGQIVWPVSVLLSHYLASIDLRDKTVLELGAGGTALPSITAAYQGAATVIATDGNDSAVLDLLHQNIAMHQKTAHNCCQLISRQLLWGNRSHVMTLLRPLKQRVDVVVAADVVQWPAVLEPLLHTVKSFLWREDVTAAATKPVFLLGIVQRAASIYNLFFQLADDMGFAVRAIAPAEFLLNGIVPATCQERGGRTTELYELTLRPDSGPPVLLQQDRDRTLGTTFEQTAFLPC